MYTCSFYVKERLTGEVEMTFLRRKWKNILLCGLAVLISACFAGCKEKGDGDLTDDKDYVFTKTSDNTELKDLMQDLQFTGNVQGADYRMPYRLYVPENYNKKKKYPLVTYYHGAGECGSDNIKQLRTEFKFLTRILSEENLKKYPCIVYAPQCAGQIVDNWVNDKQSFIRNKGYDVNKVKVSRAMEASLKIADSIIEEYSVDTDRLYVTGVSLGGLATWDAVARNPERFACALPVCGAAMPLDNADKFKNINVWAFHGSADGLIYPFTTQSMVSEIKKAGGNVLYTEYEGVEHNAWTYAYEEDNFLDFMFSSEKGKINKYFDGKTG